MDEQRHERINADDDQREGDPGNPRPPRYDLAKLVAGVTRKHAHPEVGWGQPRGAEAW